MESDSSETNLVIITKRDRFKQFWKLYWRSVLLLSIPLIFLPIAFVGKNNAYMCFYIFIVSAFYWMTDIFHPGITSFVPAVFYTISGSSGYGYIHHIFVRNEVLNCFSIMAIILAIEKSNIQRRIAIKLLLVFGCSHYRLSFLLFFNCMFLSMWFSDIIACGLIIPLVKAILIELERMGIIEMYQSIGQSKQTLERHGQKYPRPSDFTVFYFLGIAYSASIGSMSTLIGSQTNQIFKIYSESLFPSSPRIEFPQIILLVLPGVLLMETLLYLWMNSYFLGMFRIHGSVAIEINMTEEEARYVKTLLSTQYQALGKTTFHEKIVSAVVILGSILQMSFSAMDIDNAPIHSHIKATSPGLISVFLLFTLPVKLEFLKFFKKSGGSNDNPLPTAPSKSCLTWGHMQNNIDWSILFINIGSCATLEALKDSGMMNELEQPLETLGEWPAPVLAFLVILMCKILTEFASNTCVAYCILPSIARLGVATSINPHYLMMAATQACSMPFHLVTGSPVNAMVASYVHIPPWKMMSAGIGPSVLGVVVSWLTVALWSRAIWPDVAQTPAWANHNTLNQQIINGTLLK